MSADIAALARGWIGTPYRHMAATKGAGCDCLGLLRGVWAEAMGLPVPEIAPYSADWRFGGGALEAGVARVLRRCEGPPAPGMVVLFHLRRGLAPRHCGIVVASDRFVHAQERVGVVEAAFAPGWERRVAGFFAFP